jgi:hypothetical protein
VFVNEVARFFHATFFRAVPSDSFSCGGFSKLEREKTILKKATALLVSEEIDRSI